MIEIISSDFDMQREILKCKHCKNVSEVLERHYPGHMWYVGLTEDSSMTVVKNMGLSGEKGFAIDNRHISGDALKIKAIRAGGELLERYGMKRGRYNPEAHAEAKQDHSGRLIHDAS